MYYIILWSIKENALRCRWRRWCWRWWIRPTGHQTRSKWKKLQLTITLSIAWWCSNWPNRYRHSYSLSVFQIQIFAWFRQAYRIQQRQQQIESDCSFIYTHIICTTLCAHRAFRNDFMEFNLFICLTHLGRDTALIFKTRLTVRLRIPQEFHITLIWFIGK